MSVRTVRALLLEDDPAMAERVTRALERELDADVTTVARGEEALALASRPGFDVLVLDRLVVGMEGLAVLTELRRLGVETPALVLSSRNAARERTEGLEEGADDYLGKPFEEYELVARVRALLRRAARVEHPDVRGHGPLILAIRNRRALWQPGAPPNAGQFRKRRIADGRFDLQLTNREFDILLCLVEAMPDPQSKGAIWDFVWRSVRLADWQQVIHVNLSRLRTKLDERTGRRQVVALLAGACAVLGENPFDSFGSFCAAIDEGELAIRPLDAEGRAASRPAPPSFELRWRESRHRLALPSVGDIDRAERRRLEDFVPPIIATVAGDGYTVASAEALGQLARIGELLSGQRDSLPG